MLRVFFEFETEFFVDLTENCLSEKLQQYLNSRKKIVTLIRLMFILLTEKGKFHKNVSMLISMAATGKFNANLVKVSG